ncbi:MAG TPA: hypothetical protein VFZ48_01065 [Candidatus Saccharimonadales bacterium]
MMHSIARLSPRRAYRKLARALFTGGPCELPTSSGVLEFTVDMLQRSTDGVITVVGHTPAGAAVNMTISAGRDIEIKVLPLP